MAAVAKAIALANAEAATKNAASLGGLAAKALEELTKIATVRLYREVLDIRFKKGDLVPTPQFISGPSPIQETTDPNLNVF